MNRAEMISWLKEADPDRLEELWRVADGVRRENVGDEVHLRGLVEFSNRCARLCGYCGLRADNDRIERYRMGADEILACARDALDLGYGTVVLQSGEEPGLDPAWLGELVRRIKKDTSLAVTLSVGEYEEPDLKRWRAAGADRYLLRFETSNPELFRLIHPPRSGRPAVDRLSYLRLLKRLDYETGSGVMVGIPGQSYDDLARGIELFRELGLDMIGVGPFIPHPDTPLGTAEPLASGEQVPNTEEMVYKVLALTRITCPLTNIPSTTALATINPEDGRELGLERGANIVMPNLTPVKYRAKYEIYPGKVCITETGRQCSSCLRGRIERIGRVIGVGRGDSPRRKRLLDARSEL